MRILLFSLIFFLSGKLLSQQYNFVNYSLEQGLPQSQVSDICQDRFGYLWIGTETGLSRFDGIEFKNFSTEDGLPDNEIDQLFVDSKNKLWVGTPKGIASYSKNKFISYPFSEDLKTEYAVNDFSELNDQLYMATDMGVLIFSDLKFKIIAEQSESPNAIRSIQNVGDSIFYCGTRNGLLIFDGKTFSRMNDTMFLSLNVSDLSLQQNKLLISTYGNGLVILDLENKSFKILDLPVNRIRSMHATNNVILCATKNGAIELNQNEIFLYNIQNGLSFENIRSVFIDREENIWLGTDGKGLFKLTSKSIISYTKADGLSSDAVMSIAQDVEGTFYFGTYESGVTQWFHESRHKKPIIHLDKLKNSTIWSTTVDKHQWCWIGSSGGVDILDSAGRLVTTSYSGKLQTKTRSFLFLSDSVKLFGGSNGIKMWNGHELISLYDSLLLDVNKMIVHNDSVYIASTTGLYQVAISNLFQKPGLINLPENNVNSLTCDRSGNLWIGTNSKGIYVKIEDKLYPFELDADDNRSETILGLMRHSNGDIWVATLNGVYQVIFDEENLFSYRILHFGYAEGLITLECNQNAIFEDRNENVWVGTSEGLARINPKRNDELFRFRRPELLITGVRLFLDEFNYSDYPYIENQITGAPISITLPYNKNHLTFDFTGLNLKDPEGVRYQYRLLGAEEDWSPMTENRYATYSFIKNGEYDFEVMATNNSGQWSETSRMHVTILPPFWLTWWFIMISIIAGILLIILTFQIRIKSIKQKQENEKLGYKNRLLFLEQQSLNASMNRHFIFNSLNSIQYFINSSNKLAANKYLTSFAKLIRKNLDSSQANNFIVTLQEEIERIELYLSLEKMRFEGKFEYKIECSPELDAESIEIPSMILQPFVENSIIHGVLPQQKPGHITILIYQEFGYLIFEVTDDGVGIETSLKSKKNQSSGDHESMGMEITNRRIDLLRKLTGENLMIIGPFQMNDQDGNSLGTKVIIKIHMEN